MRHNAFQFSDAVSCAALRQRVLRGNLSPRVEPNFAHNSLITVVLECFSGSGVLPRQSCLGLRLQSSFRVQLGEGAQRVLILCPHRT